MRTYTEPMANHEHTAEEFLGWLMARRGWSSLRLSELTAGDVSASAVRYYTRGESRPKASKAEAIAVLFGPNDGEKLLRLWGHLEMADRFNDNFSAVIEPHRERIEAIWGRNRIEYEGDPLTSEEIEEVAQFIDFVKSKR